MKRMISFLLFILCLLTISLPVAAETVDKSDLGQMLNEVCNPDLYTEDSYQAYQKAVNDALAVYENDDATQESVSAVLSTLMEARDGLILLLDRNKLLDYVSYIDEYLHGTQYDVTSESATVLKNAKNEFLDLYKMETLTEDQFVAAQQTFDQIKELTKDSKKITKFAPEEAEDNIIIPKKIISNSQGLGKVTKIRLTILGIGIGFLLLGTIAAILYFKPPRFLQ